MDLYTLEINEENDGWDFTAFVDSPAHQKNWVALNEQVKPLREPIRFLDDDKRIVTGVAISVDQPIYRNSPDIGEHNVIFTKENTLEIFERMMKSNFMHNVNEMHREDKPVQDIFLLEAYIIDRERGVNPPNEFKDQNLKDGSIIVSYKVESDEVWSKVKSGVYAGFSIEGYFNRVKVNKNEMSKEDKTKFERIKEIVFGSDKPETKEKFTDATTVDGVKLRWEGELAEGVQIMVIDQTEDESISETIAQAGEYVLANDDESTTAITVGDEGLVTSISEGEAEVVEEEVLEEPVEEMAFCTEEKFNELKEAFENYKTETTETKDKFEANLKELHANEIKELKEEFNSKLEKIIDGFVAELDKEDKKKFERVDRDIQTWRTLS